MQPADFAVIGDYGHDGPAEAAVARLIAGWSPTIIVTTGDNNYPDGRAATFDDNVAKYFGEWIAFGPSYRGRYRKAGTGDDHTRFFPALGNHDWHTPQAKDHLAALSLPGNGRYYAVERGDVAFFFVDSNMKPPSKYGYADADVQAAWLKQALGTSKAKANIVVFHHPPYSVGSHRGAEWMRWPFRAWGAQLVLSGHNHVYERHVVDGLSYVVNGFGGTWADSLKGACHLPESDFDLCVSNTFGAMRGRAVKQQNGSSELIIEAMTIDGRAIDRFTLPL